MAHLGTPILVDGTHGEGGGALVRAALAMSALTQQALRVEGVRGGTPYPGLDVEDLTVLRALAVSCAAETTGVEAGSTAFSFLPTRRAQALNTTLDSLAEEGRRGANANVVLHALLPVLARTGAYSRLEAEGETHGHKVLSYSYFAQVTLATFRRMGLYAFPDLERAGFGRDSRGVVTLDVEPSVVQGLNWEARGKLLGCRGLFSISNLPEDIAKRGMGHLKSLAQHSGIPLQMEVEQVRAERPGIHLTLWAEYERGMGGSAAMGARGIKVETLAQGAFDELFQWMRSDSTVDPFLADQILIAAAISENDCAFSTSRLTQRFLTTVWVVKQFLPIHLTVKGVLDGPGSITVRR